MGENERGADDVGRSPSDDDLGAWRSPRAHRGHAEATAAVTARAWGELQAHGRPDPPAEPVVETPFGPTVAFSWPGEGTPLVLLHGAGTSSLMWVPVVAELPGRAVVALDVVGDPGRSTQTAPVRDADDLASWLDTALSGLGVERAHVVGASYGGWLAFAYARRSPARVASLSLVEPVLDPLRRGFWTYGLRVGAALALPRRLGDPWLRRLRMGVLADHPDTRTVALLGQTRFRRRLPRPVPVDDADLGALAVPLLVVLGSESPIHEPPALAARVRAARPDARVHVLDEAGHTLPVDAADRVAPLLAAFADEVDGAAGCHASGTAG